MNHIEIVNHTPNLKSTFLAYISAISMAGSEFGSLCSQLECWNTGNVE